MMKSILRLGQEFIFTNQETSRNPPCSENWFARIQSDAMLSLSMLSAAVVLILSGLRPAFALPTDNAALLPRTVPADTIDKYTVAVSVSNRKCYKPMLTACNSSSRVQRKRNLHQGPVFSTQKVSLRQRRLTLSKMRCSPSG